MAGEEVYLQLAAEAGKYYQTGRLSKKQQAQFEKSLASQQEIADRQIRAARRAQIGSVTHIRAG